MTVKERYRRAEEIFDALMPDPKSELHFDTPFQALVSVILSAQCTDKRINQVTPPLFEAFPTAEALAAATPDQVTPFIKSVTYPNAKTRNIIAMAQALVHEHGGQLPHDMDALLSLPGVGRKTANVILAVVYGQQAMAVDTHVFRVSRRMGLVPMTADTPLKVERTLVRRFTPELLGRAHHWLILHGRYVCKARKPQCMDCELKALCATYNRRGTAK